MAKLMSENFRWFAFAAELKDPRRDHLKRHPLVNIVTISLCAIVCGATAWGSPVGDPGRSRGFAPAPALMAVTPKVTVPSLSPPLLSPQAATASATTTYDTLPKAMRVFIVSQSRCTGSGCLRDSPTTLVDVDRRFDSV